MIICSELEHVAQNVSNSSFKIFLAFQMPQTRSFSISVMHFWHQVTGKEFQFWSNSFFV